MSDVVTASIGSNRPASLIRWHSATSLKSAAISVERPRLGLGDRELLLGVAAENPLAEFALGGLVGQLDRIGPVRLHGDDGDVLPGNHASKTQAGLEILKLRHGRLRVDRIGFGLTS